MASNKFPLWDELTQLFLDDHLKKLVLVKATDGFCRKGVCKAIKFAEGKVRFSLKPAWIFCNNLEIEDFPIPETKTLQELVWRGERWGYGFKQEHFLFEAELTNYQALEKLPDFIIQKIRTGAHKADCYKLGDERRYVKEGHWFDEYLVLKGKVYSYTYPKIKSTNRIVPIEEKLDSFLKGSRGILCHISKHRFEK